MRQHTLGKLACTANVQQHKIVALIETGLKIMSIYFIYHHLPGRLWKNSNNWIN